MDDFTRAPSYTAWLDSLSAAELDQVRAEWKNAGRPVMLARADARDLLALALELETLAVETHAGSWSLRRLAALLTQAVSPTDYPDREHILLDRKAWHDYLDWWRPSEENTKVTERPLSDPEEGG